MRFSVRAFILTLCLSLFASSLAPFTALAQSYPANTSAAQAEPAPFETPLDPTIPANQHVRVQSLLIDILSAAVCQLGGIDPVDPSKPCLDVNPVTRKLGYSQNQFDENGHPRIGGILGASTHMIGLMYTPTISASQYTDYLARNFGIAKPVYAQGPGYGFTGLNPLLALWTAVRNISYFLLMVAFVLIGLGIMLRIKIDPRTVMTLQNQIPRIIIGILLVTFSYGIAGTLIDTMWLTTYVGINVITSAGGTTATGTTNQMNGTAEPLSKLATENLLQTPINYVNSVFKSNGFLGDWGIGNLTDQVSFGLGSFLEDMVRGFFGVTQNDSCLSLLGGLNVPACLASVFGFLASILLWLVVLITLTKLLFSVWFTLLKAYTYIIFYTIGAPIFIVLGLLPGKPYGFEKWLRSMVANLAVFPLTAWLFVIARLFIDLFQDDKDTQFIPPLVFQPHLGIWGIMLAFGVLLMTPTILSMLQEALKVPGTKYGSAIGAGIGAGAAMPKAATGAMWARATRRAKYGEHDAGWLRQKFAGPGVTAADQAAVKSFWRNPIKATKNVVNRARARTYTHNADGKNPRS
jgi:hypothetical protein